MTSGTCLGESGFECHVVISPAAEAKPFLRRSRQFHLIGCLGVHRFDKRVDGLPFVVFRVEAGLLP